MASKIPKPARSKTSEKAGRSAKPATVSPAKAPGGAKASAKSATEKSTPLLLRLPISPIARELSRLYPDTFSLNRGKACKFSAGRAQGYAVSLQGEDIHIHYREADDLMMALGDMMAAGAPVAAEKIAPYDFRGIMLDVSRNAVVKTEFLKDRIARLALLGLNRFCLYTEDVYPVPGEPLFGYARGCYSEKELRDLARHAKQFGVTVFPCIQTLGHMEHILKYPHYFPLKDNDYVYNVYAEELYAFIEKTIDAAVAPYKAEGTDIIHIGMDETFGLGRGFAFKEGEGIHPRKLYVEHVRRVVEICRKKGLKPMMWGDIVLGHGGEQAMAQDEAGRLPKDVTMNYWQYAWCDANKYDHDLGDFRKMGYPPVVSPGTWSWSRFFPAYFKAEANIGSLLEAGKRTGVRGALLTHWGDDGHECFFDFNLCAHAYFLSQCTEQGNILATARKKFQAVFGEDFDAVRSTEKIDMAGITEQALLPANVGKCFFYDDPAQGLFSGLPFVKPAEDYYRALTKEMAALAKRKSLFQPLFRFAEAFCDFLAMKSDLRRKAAAAYKKKDKRALKLVLKDIAAASVKLKKVHRLYREHWLMERSPFGLEIIEGRIGILFARLDYLSHILTEHLAGHLPKLEELEFAHYSMYHESRHPEYQPAIWPEFMVHYSGLASRNTIKWW